MKERRTASFDGTSIAYQVFGTGPPIAIGNGIGVDWRGMRLQVEHLARDHSVFLWDYRGCYGSGRPPRGADLGPAVHARDLAAVLDAEAIEQPIDYLGWSMGVQVGFELFRLGTHAIRSFVAISGVLGRPSRTAFGTRHLEPLIRSAIRVAIRHHRVVHTVIRGSTRLPALVPALKLFRLIDRDLREETFLAMVRGMASTDKDVYLRCLLGLDDHDASDIVPAIDFPVLFIAGERDLFVPPVVARYMASQIGSSELVVLPHCTHYSIVERPERVNAEISRFLTRP